MKQLRLAVLCGVAALALAACEEAQPGSPTATITVPASTPTATLEPSLTPSPTPDDGLVTIEIEGVSGAAATVRVELAITDDEVRTGLMHRESMDEDVGMLFLFDPPSHTGFWMKDTLIPLDIAYIDSEGTIKEIVRGEPLNQTVLRPQLPYWYVLEVNAGWFERHGLGVGDRAIIPENVATKG